MMNQRNPLAEPWPIDASRLPIMERVVMLDIVRSSAHRHGVIPDDLETPAAKALLAVVRPDLDDERLVGAAVRVMVDIFGTDEQTAGDDVKKYLAELEGQADRPDRIPPERAASMLRQARTIREAERAEDDAFQAAHESPTRENRTALRDAMEATDQAKREVPSARRSLDDMVGEVAASWRETQGHSALGLVTPRFPNLSDMLFGWRGLVVVAAMPGIGKTTLTLAAGIDAVEQAENDACFAFVSFEMPTKTLVSRVLADMSGIPQRTLHVGAVAGNPVDRGGLRLQDKQHSNIREAMTRLSCLSDRVALIGKDDIGPMRGRSADGRDCMAGVERAVSELQRRSGRSRSFVVLDHLGVIPVDRGDPFANDTDRTRYILSGLTTLRDRLDGERNPVVVVAQARKADWEDGAGLASIMGTADTAYSADAAIVMQRLKPTDKELSDPTADQPLFARIAKGRDMMRYGDIRMSFDPKTSALKEVSE